MFILCASDRTIKVSKNDILVSDSVNVYPVKFNFSPEWKNLAKTAVFRTVFNKKVEDSYEILLDDSNICNIPWELLLKHGRLLQAGVYGTQSDDLIRNTIWVPLGEVYEGAKNIDMADNHPEEPTPDVYQQILSQMGNLEDLETEDKSSLVGAINEVLNSIGSGVGPDGPLPAGVASFNSRTGAVMPMAGDYTAEMVGATPVENFDKHLDDFENYKVQLEVDLSGKVDTTGGTVTGPILFSDGTSTLSDSEDSTVAHGGITVSSEGIYKDSDGPLNIYTNSGEVSFSSNTTLTNVVGDETKPNSVPNMEQLKDSVDSVKTAIPTKTSQIQNDSGYITENDIPEIPTKVSQLENDSNFAYLDDIPTKNSQLENDSNFATEQFVKDSIADIEVGGGNVSKTFLINAPVGAVIIWSGTEDSVPVGWSVCNGDNGTLDLRDKFVLGSGTAHNVGETGGSEEVALTIKQMPSHSHSYTKETFQKGKADTGNLLYTYYTYSYESTSSVGGNEPHSNMPPYYTALYIQKTGETPSDFAKLSDIPTPMSAEQLRKILMNGEI